MMTGREYNILLIEDNPADARLIREMLLYATPERLALTLMSTLKAGLQAVHENGQYDVILLDLSLPDSHGMDTLLQARAAAPRLPIIVLTGNDDEELGIDAVQSGAQDYLPKDGIDDKLLLRAIRYAIERHRTEMVLRQSEEAYRSLIDDVFDTTMVAVIILNEHFQVVWCNAATEVYFGIQRDYLLGADKRVLIDNDLKCIIVSPEDYPIRLLKAYEERLFTERFECHVQPEGTRQERWLEYWSQPITSGMYAGGRIEQYTDITARKVLEMAEQQQRQYVEALSEIAALLTSSLNLNDVLERILNNLGRVVPHDAASIVIPDENDIRITQQLNTAESHAAQANTVDKQLQLTRWQQLKRLFDAQKWVIVADIQHNELMRTLADQTDLQGYIGVPVRFRQETLGFLNLFSKEAHFYSEPDAERLTAFAELAAIAIQNARLYQQSHQLAALEERQRLARELHDSVSQTLYTAHNISEAALRSWQRDPKRAHDLVEDVYQLMVTALAEMRVLLLELRPAALMQVNLKQLFEQYLWPIQKRRQFTLQLLLDEIPTMPPDIQMALYRITQEALNNIDKHAQATSVEVHIVNHPDSIELKIRDDGIGFTPDASAATSMGLNIMQERAEKIGALLTIESHVGAGTAITAVWHKKASA